MKLSLKERKLVLEYAKKLQTKRLNESVNSTTLANRLLNYLVDTDVIPVRKKTHELVQYFKKTIDDACK